jgi:hypothetical protein
MEDSKERIAMKKIVLMIAAVTALAATASAPAEAHRLHIFRPGAIAAATVAAIATDALVYGPGFGPDYYYAPTPLYYGAGPVFLPYPGFRHRW